MGCDLVSMKADAALEAAWRAVDRPHPRLSLEKVLDGERTMAKEFDGTLITETMLVDGINDSDRDIAAVAEHIASLGVQRAYVSVPIRPPAVSSIGPASPERVMACYMAFKDMGIDVELNIATEEGGFTLTGEFATYILGTTSVHPLREDQMEGLLEKGGEGARTALQGLLANGSVSKVEFSGKRFYIRSR